MHIITNNNWRFTNLCCRKGQEGQQEYEYVLKVLYIINIDFFTYDVPINRTGHRRLKRKNSKVLFTKYGWVV